MNRADILDRLSPKAYRASVSRLIRKWHFKLFYHNHLKMGVKISFAQSGEDLIALNIFDSIGITKPTYLDVGAYHPYNLSNTALLYLKGCRGMNVEPNPALISAFIRERPDDINLNLGIAAAQGELDYFVMSASTLNTFSKESAEEFSNEGYPIVEKKRIPVRTITEVVDTYYSSQFPDFLSLDIEGLELSVLASIDYDKSSPLVICIETLSFSSKLQGIKNHDVITFLESKGYFVYADTYINTLFVKNEVFRAS